MEVVIYKKNWKPLGKVKVNNYKGRWKVRLNYSESINPRDRVYAELQVKRSFTMRNLQVGPGTSEKNVEFDLEDIFSHTNGLKNWGSGGGNRVALPNI